MKAITKIIALSLSAVMLCLSIASCGGQGTDDQGSTGENQTSASDQADSDDESQKLSVRTEELWLESDGKNIYGVMYLPGEEKESYPTVILSHGFNSSSVLNEGYAESFAKNGFAAYIFDFCGGGRGTQSDGDTTEMSVLTEAQNLMDVMEQLSDLDYVDSSQLFLFGLSQGGFISAYTAAQKPDDVAGLVLFYPAFSLQNDCWERHGSIENIPDEEEIMGVPISSLYSIDAMSFDIYEVIGNYKGDVLICHGDKDTVVDLSYSERAAEVYDNAELQVIQYGEHGFQGQTMREATNYAIEFLEAHVN